ncbi:MAG: T9SS type A sorting domain-containing protein, partial [Bacteroidia bacterium]
TGNGITGNNFDPAQAGAGLHSITYTYSDTAGCINSHTEDVIIYAPAQPVITQNADTLFSSIAGDLQWLDSTLTIIAGETGNYFLPSQNGIYYVQFTDTNGCISISDPFIFVIINVSEIQSVNLFTVYPNPANDFIILKFNSKNNKDSVCKITDQLGRIVFYEKIETMEIKINTSGLINGIYNLTVSDENNPITKKIILMNN